jgi:hypothetical protein
MLTDQMERVGNELDRAVTRRRVVTTGAKLAYAAPLVAVSFKLSERGVGATSPTLQCFHSTGLNGGCKPVCTSTGCSGNACDGCNGGNHPCDVCCTDPGGQNKCPSDKYCTKACFACNVATDTATFVC